MKKIKSTILILMLVLILSACLPKKNLSLDNARNTPDIDIKAANIIEQVESNRGIHGDGESYIKLKIENPNELNEKIEKNEYWQKLIELDNHKDYKNYLTLHNEKDENLSNKLHNEIESIQNGYFFFKDRFQKSNDDKEVNFKSFNFSFAIFDKEKSELIYIKSDM